MKAWYLRFHRWIAFTFALPLLVVIATGVLLAFEPALVASAIKPGTLTADRIASLIHKHDPQGQTRTITHRSYDGTIALSAGRGGGTRIDTATGDLARPSAGVADWLVTARRLHETLLIDASWLVIASSYVMLVLAILGVAMGWPRFRNTLSGWHMGAAWVLLPLLVLSPLTGIFLAHGITFAGQPPVQAQQGGPPLTLAEGIRIAGARHDLSGLVWLRPMGGRMAMRIVEEGEFKVYAVTAAGTVPMPRNWPRLWHEGNFAGTIGAVPNIVTALAAMGLLVTGLWIWGRRKLRLAARRRERPARA